MAKRVCQKFPPKNLRKLQNRSALDKEIADYPLYNNISDNRLFAEIIYSLIG